MSGQRPSRDNAQPFARKPRSHCARELSLRCHSCARPIPSSTTPNHGNSGTKSSVRGLPGKNRSSSGHRGQTAGSAERCRRPAPPRPAASWPSRSAPAALAEAAPGRRSAARRTRSGAGQTATSLQRTRARRMPRFVPNAARIASVAAPAWPPRPPRSASDTPTRNRKLRDDRCAPTQPPAIARIATWTRKNDPGRREVVEAIIWGDRQAARRRRWLGEAPVDASVRGSGTVGNRRTGPVYRASVRIDVAVPACPRRRRAGKRRRAQGIERQIQLQHVDARFRPAHPIAVRSVFLDQLLDTLRAQTAAACNAGHLVACRRRADIRIQAAGRGRYQVHRDGRALPGSAWRRASMRD